MVSISDSSAFSAVRAFSEATKTSKVFYRLFGLLRFILAFMVMGQHFGWLLPSDARMGTNLADYQTGDIAVLGFFVLSGLIVTEAAYAIYAARPLAFVANRALRIYPPLLLAYAVSILAHIALMSLDPKLPVGYAPSVAFREIFQPWNLIANFLAVFPFAGAGIKAHPMTYNFLPYAWAIQIELQFYVILGAALWVGLRLELPKVLTSLAVLALFATLLRVPGLHFACFFALGGTLYFALRGVFLTWPLAIALAVACLHVFNQSPSVVAARPWTVQYLLLAAELAAMCLLFGLRNRRLQQLDRWFGELSYPLYLNQYISIVLAFVLFGPSYIVLFGSLVTALALAYVAARLIEPMTEGARNRLRGMSIGMCKLD